MIDVVCAFATAAAVHVLDHNCWISGNMFFQERNHGFYPKICASARCGERYDRDGFALIKWGLSEGRSQREQTVSDESHGLSYIPSLQVQAVQAVQPPPLSSPAMRVRIKAGELNRAKRLNGLNHLNSPVLPRRERRWTGKLVEKPDGLGVAWQFPNRFLIFFRQ